ncbi:MAG: hypothetical protein MI749_19890, partial [Desulfovibrionales bacterium]|nr:hypothetical protein [Desulfovibrionales bacterium]
KKELKSLNMQVKKLNSEIKKEKSELDPEKKRDYQIYQACVKTAYVNDREKNREEYISWSERTILHTLATQLGLSREEERGIRYGVVTLKKYDVEAIIAELKESGIIFFNRRTQTIFIPIEIIYQLRKILEIELPNKYLRRILRHFKDAEINAISRKYRIDRKLDRIGKIRSIIDMGLNVSGMLAEDMHSPRTKKTERAKRIQELIKKELNLELKKTGRSLEDKIFSLLDYLRNQEKEDSKSLSRDGLAKLISALVEFKPNLNDIVKEEFEIQNDEVMDVTILNDYHIGPRDLLYLIPKKELIDFCKSNGI